VFRYLIETKGCNINLGDDDCNTPLHFALEKFDANAGGDIAVLMYLLSQEGIEYETETWNCYSIFHAACNNINNLPIDAFKLLIEPHGYHIHVRDDDSYGTPFRCALEKFNPNKGGDIAVLRYLLSQCDESDITESSCYGVLLAACNNINNLPIDVFKLLIEILSFNISKQGDDSTLLHMACQHINKIPLDAFKVLIETAGCDVNVMDQRGKTPFHYALDEFNPQWGGDINILAYLISQKDVNINIKDERGCALLHLACIVEQHVGNSAELTDTIACQIVELIAERYVQDVLDGKAPIEAATTTM
jgi:ankyrin repeat protein